MSKRILLFMTALGVGSLLARINIPIPFLLGGVLVAIAVKTCMPASNISWPKLWRDCGLTAAGYGIGANFSTNAWDNMLHQLLGVAEATGSILLVSILLAFVSAKIAGEDLKSCVIGMLPGGMTMSMLLTEEDKDINPNVVIVMQVLRLFGVVVSVPFLVIYLLDAKIIGSSTAMPNYGGYHWLIFIPLAFCGGFLAKKINMSTPILLGAILATAAFSVVMGRVQPIPGWLMAPAQVSIGIFMGMQLDADRLAKAKNVIPCVVAGTVVLIGISVVMANVLSARYGFSLITAFLAMSPGGIAEMSLAGMSMGADVSIILTYQLVRVFAINLLVPPLLKLCFGRR